MTYLSDSESDSVDLKRNTSTNGKQKMCKTGKNYIKENLSKKDASEDIVKEEINKLSTGDYIRPLNNNESTKNQEIIDKYFNIEIKGNTINYNNRIFIYNKNASKYISKEEIKIYYCQSHYHMIHKLRNNKQLLFIY